MASYPGDWLKDADEVRRRLKDDAKTYFDLQKQLRDKKTEQEKTVTLINTLAQYSDTVLQSCPDWTVNSAAQAYPCRNINAEWTSFLSRVTSLKSKLKDSKSIISASEETLHAYYQETGQTEQALQELMTKESQVIAARRMVNDTDAQMKSRIDAIKEAEKQIAAAMKALEVTDRSDLPDNKALEEHKAYVSQLRDEALAKLTQAKTQLETHEKNIKHLKEIEAELDRAKQRFQRWDSLNRIFGGTRFRTLVQTYILRPLLNNANIYLEQITDRYRLTCSEDNEQLSILVLDRYNKDQVRSVTVLSGGERFMISLALSLALSSLNRPDMNVNILFIDEGFGTLDERSLDSVMSTLEKLQEIAGQTNRRVGIISHREELEERIPTKIKVVKRGEGRSTIELSIDS
jgi:DNA repair exonuclease SbcCD ATPase subunit